MKNADGTSVSINNGVITITNKDGTTTAITVEKGQTTVSDRDAGKDSIERITYESKDPNTGETIKREVATMDDGLKFKGDTKDSETANVTLGKTVNVVGGKTDSKLENNIGVKSSKDSNGNAILEVKLSKDIDLTKEGSVTIGNTTVNNNGVVVNRNTGNNADNPSITNEGVNAGNMKITNVAPGRIAADSKDAVNGSQLHAVKNDINNVNNKVDKLDKRVRGIGASSAAASSLPQAFMSGKSMVSAAGGTYGGASAVAVGYSRASDNGKVILKLQGTANSEGHFSGGAGIGYQW